MDAISYTTARQNLAKTMDRVCNDHETVIITRHGQQSVVIMSLEAAKVLEETADRLRRPNNVERLLGAIAQLTANYRTEQAQLDWKLFGSPRIAVVDARYSLGMIRLRWS
jgi:antitoxin YefM